MRFIIATLSLPDADDRHVLAAAVEANATLIVTFNLSDFPRRILEVYGVEAQHPDVFLCDLFTSEPDLFFATLVEMVAQLKNPPRTIEQYIDILLIQGLQKIAERLVAYTVGYMKEI